MGERRGKEFAIEGGPLLDGAAIRILRQMYEDRPMVVRKAYGVLADRLALSEDVRWFVERTIMHGVTPDLQNWLRKIVVPQANILFTALQGEIPPAEVQEKVRIQSGLSQVLPYALGRRIPIPPDPDVIVRKDVLRSPPREDHLQDVVDFMASDAGRSEDDGDDVED